MTVTAPPFDPYLDADNPYITEIPERFVYDEPVDEDGLAEMSIPERIEVLTELDREYEEYMQARFEMAAEAANERWFEDRGWADLDY